jgi:hypothetical protein
MVGEAGVIPQAGSSSAARNKHTSGAGILDSFMALLLEMIL